MSINYIVEADSLEITIPMSAIKRIVENGTSAAEIKRYNGGILKLVDGEQLAMDMTRTMDQLTCGEPGGEPMPIIEEFLDQLIYATVEMGTDGITVVSDD